MNFDECKVYTALNADELKVGSKVIVADSLQNLRLSVTDNHEPVLLQLIKDESSMLRFVANGDWALAYLVEEPDKLKWTDLKIGDIITLNEMTVMVTQIDRSDGTSHIYAGQIWITDNNLGAWRKVDD